MKFKKINDHTIECYISKADLDAYGISMEDLVKNPDKTNEFVHKVVMMSQQELDFNPQKNAMLQAQISPWDDGILMLVFDKPTEKLGEYFLNQLKKRIMNSISGDKKSEEMEEMFSGFGDFASEEDEAPQVMKEALKPGNERCYMFPTFENLMDFVSKCGTWQKMNSKLYYQDKTYFLVFSIGLSSQEQYEVFCTLADEYGIMSADCDGRIQLIREHTEPIIAKNAIETLKNTII